MSSPSDPGLPEAAPLGAPLRTHREIALSLGIGRARVFNLEQSALTKLRAALQSVGIADENSFFESRRSVFDQALSAVPRSAACDKPPPSPFSPNHGWLGVDRIASLNGGSEDEEDVARAYTLLKERQQNLLRPPVLVKRGGAVDEPYTVEAAAQQEGQLLLRCWPQEKGGPRSVASLSDMHTTALVESVFDEDETGPFDVPVLLCVILSPRRPDSPA